MQKNIIISIIFLILFGIFSLSTVYSENIDSVADQLEVTAGKLENVAETVDSVVNNPIKSREELRKGYLKVKWEESLKNSTIIGPIILTYEKVSPYTDPFIQFVVGTTPSLSWIFCLTLFFWILLVKYYLEVYNALYYFSTFSKNTCLIISLSFFIILTVIQFFQKISILFANSITSFISTLGEWYVQLLLVVIMLFLIIFVGRLTKQIKILMRAKKIEKIRKMKDKERDAEFKRMKTSNDFIEKEFNQPTEGSETF